MCILWKSTTTKISVMTMTAKSDVSYKETDDETMRRCCRYFAEYASVMLGCGATCVRITKNIRRMASPMSYDVDMTILPSHILMTVKELSGDERWCQYSCGIARCPVSYSINTRLSNLSWKVYEGRVSVLGSVPMFEKIVAEKPFDPWMVLWLVVAANASFCRLFGGDSIAMAIVAAATLLGYSVKNVLLSRHIDVRLVFIAASFVSSVIGAAGYLFHLSATPELALGTSVLYLIPGIPYINSVSDLLDCHYLCSFSRFMNALVLTACISIGLTAGFLLMNIKIF